MPLLQEAAERVQLLPAALRALSAALLADGKGSKHPGGATHALCKRLLAHPRAEVFLDVVFDAVRTLYRMVSAFSSCALCQWLLLAAARKVMGPVGRLRAVVAYSTAISPVKSPSLDMNRLK